VPSVVHLIDDDELFRTATARLLRTSGYQVEQYGSADQFLESAPNRTPGCILLDIQMPGVGGLELQDRLQRLDSILPIVFLSGHGDISTSVRAIKAGAEDFLTKPVSKEHLFDAISRAIARYEQAQARAARLDSVKALVDLLTPREKQVFALLVRGKLHKQIAYELGTAERTIKAHRHNIMEKLQVRSLAEAVLIADRVGISAEGTHGTGK
jgi:FixJ family two-component response regulator